MLTTIAFVIFLASIIVFFSDELQKNIKKILRNSRFQLLAPLFFLSWLTIHHGWQLLLWLMALRIQLDSAAYFLSRILPWTSGPQLTIARMLLLSAIPLFLLGLRDLFLYWKKLPKKNIMAINLIILVIWVVAAFLLMMKLDEYFF